MPYEVKYNDEDELIVDGKVTGVAYLNYQELADLKGDWCEYLQELLDKIDPDKKIPQDLVPVIAALAYTMISDFTMLTGELETVSDFAHSHRHVEKTVAVVEKN